MSYNIGASKIYDDAILPNRNEGDAGFDLHTYKIEQIQPHNKKLGTANKNADGSYTLTPNIIYHISTGIRWDPQFADCFGLIKPRSGVSANYGINVLAGVVDSSYQGEIKIILTTILPLDVNIGDRLAQMVVIPIKDFHIAAANSDISGVPVTIRGEKGFGSSGE